MADIRSTSRGRKPMNEVKLYCTRCSLCGSFVNENALITSQGIGSAVVRHDGVLTVPIIAPRRNFCNNLARCYG
jgi:hypothetical protein